MSREHNSQKIRKTTMTALLFAIALILSVLESMLPVIPTLPPGVKLGLSNIVTMYALVTMGFSTSVTIAVLKSSFVLITRSITAGALSFCGGFFSIIIMVLLLKIPHIKKHYILLSCFGAIAHNIAQLALATVIAATPEMIYILPVLVISGVAMGAISGLTLKVVMPYINSINKP